MGLKKKLKYWLVSFRYAWASASAYLYQDSAPLMSRQWEQEADAWKLEAWRMRKGLA